ncbi:MAG: orotate phosphoribosyltransferase [Oscillospiraceae bacterium]|nr:orotate phosphoribosyltransferase [Oscillospiraceae bacterium]
MNKEDIARRIYETAHITGTFTLRSGQVSNEYFDKYLFEAQPALLREIADVMRGLIPAESEVLAGLEMGGIPIATAISLASGMPAAFVRKQAKQYGTCKLAEGADVRGKRVCVVEDVVTTGGQIIESVRELRERGAVISVVICAIQRNPAATEILAKEGLELRSAFTMEYIKSVMNN